MSSDTTANVSFTTCTSYEPEALRNAIEQLLTPLGGISAFVTPGCRVLVKPNMLTDSPPEEAVTTHPEVLRQVLRLLKSAGAEVVVADSPAFAANVERVWQVTGILDVCNEERVPLRRMEAAKFTTLMRDGITFKVSNLALHNDLIINLPKVKTHSLTVLTAAVKNFYGTIPGQLKTELHKTYSQPLRFGALIRSVCQAMPPSLTIADAILAMEGEGPSSGKPIALNFMAASADPFALDLTLCDVLRINPERVPYLTGMSRRPAYTSLAVHGEQPEVKRFRLPRHTQQATFSLLPGSLVRLVGKFIWVRPSFSSACVRCGKCVTACPVEALSLPANNTRPRLKAKTCIGCCCCHEVCPARAITMRPSLLLRIARRSSSFSHRSVTTNAGSSTRS